MTTPTPAEAEKRRLLSDENLCREMDKAARFIGPDFRHPRAENWLEAHEKLLVDWTKAGRPYEWGSLLHERDGLKWREFEVRPHRHQRGEMLQLVHRCHGATVVVPLLDEESWGYLELGHAPSSRFEHDEVEGSPCPRPFPTTTIPATIKADPVQVVDLRRLKEDDSFRQLEQHAGKARNARWRLWEAPRVGR